VAFHEIDVRVGARLRLRRTTLGMSQEQLGSAVGLTFQQIQKYERGANRIGASRLYEFSRILGVPISYFFSDLGADEGAPIIVHRDPPAWGGEAGAADEDSAAPGREVLELVRAYYQIDNVRVRARLFELVKSVGKNASED